MFAFTLDVVNTTGSTTGSTTGRQKHGGRSPFAPTPPDVDAAPPEQDVTICPFTTGSRELRMKPNSEKVHQLLLDQLGSEFLPGQAPPENISNSGSRASVVRPTDCGLSELIDDCRLLIVDC